jgi:hypothetical protein
MARQAPKHLKPATAAWWHHVVATYELEQHHERILTPAAEAWDRAQEAREVVADEGADVDDRFGQRKTHPQRRSSGTRGSASRGSSASSISTASRDQTRGRRGGGKRCLDAGVCRRGGRSRRARSCSRRSRWGCRRTRSCGVAPDELDVELSAGDRDFGDGLVELDDFDGEAQGGAR